MRFSLSIKQCALVAIILLAAFLRFWQIGQVPSGISNDEAGYIYSSYSVWKTGHDVAGKFLPLSINLDNSFSPVYIYLDAPFVGLLGLSPFAGRLPYAILGVVTVLLLFLLTKELLRNDSIALIGAFLLAISPWHVQISRAALDATVALCFFLGALYLFVRMIRTKGNINWSIPFFLLGFYSYHATKVFFVFLIPLLLISYRHDLLKRKKQLIVFILLCICIVLSFLYVSQTQTVTRQQVFFWNDMTTVTKVVNRERNTTLASPFVSHMFSNKLLYFLRVFRENYLGAFSLEYLFLYGEPSGLSVQYGTLYRGVLYSIEFPFLLMGVYFLLKNNKGKILFGLLLISPLASAFNSDKSYANRSVMLLPFLEIVVAMGIYFFLQLLHNWKRSFFYAGVLGVGILYTIVFSQYFYQYFYRYSIYGAEAWRRSSKDISLYVGKVHNNYDKVYFADSEQMFLLQYAIHNNIQPAEVQRAWREFPHTSYGNVSFDWKCGDKKNDVRVLLPPHTLLVTRYLCENIAIPSGIVHDMGEVNQALWQVYKKDAAPTIPEILN